MEEIENESIVIIKDKLLVKNPVVSVVIPSFNRKEIIYKTIDSILEQECSFDFEIVISDDNSYDGVKDVLKVYQSKWPEKIILIFQKQNVGLGANWATAIKYSRGKYIANCDNDDYWHYKRKLQLQVDFLDTNIEYGLCHTYHRNFYKSTNKIIEYNFNHNDKISEPLYLAIFYLRGFSCCNSSIMYRKSVIDNYINIEDYIKYKFTIQDWNTWVILAFYTKFHCLPISTTTVLIDNNSITRNADYKSLENRIIKEEETYKYVCSKFPDILHYDAIGHKIYLYNSILSIAFKNIDYNSAKMISKKLKEMGYKTKKNRIASNPIIFYIFCYIKRVSQLLKKLHNFTKTV
jgi:glucosyltransferase